MTQLPRKRDIPIQFRASQRITITVPYSVFNRLNDLAHKQGRSFSNCAAYYLERGMDSVSGSSGLLS